VDGIVASTVVWGREDGIVASQVEWEREPGIPTFLEVWVNGAGTVDLQSTASIGTVFYDTVLYGTVLYNTVEWGRGRFGIHQWQDSQVKNKNVIEKILHEKKITNHDIAMFSLLIVYVRKMSSILFIYSDIYTENLNYNGMLRNVYIQEIFYHCICVQII